MAILHTQKLATGGIASIKWVAPEDIDADTAWVEPFFTTKDSVNITEAEATKSEIMIDQKDAPVYLNYAVGDFTVTATVPDVDAGVLANLYTTTTAPYAPTGFTATGIKTDVKVVNKMFMITFDSGQYIVICNGDMTASLNGSSLSTTALSHNIVITAKAGLSAFNQGADVIMYNTL